MVLKIFGFLGHKMKTYKNLYPRIWAYENLYEAWRNAARGKRKARGVAAF